MSKKVIIESASKLRLVQALKANGENFSSKQKIQNDLNKVNLNIELKENGEIFFLKQKIRTRVNSNKARQDNRNILNSRLLRQSTQVSDEIQTDALANQLERVTIKPTSKQNRLMNLS